MGVSESFQIVVSKNIPGVGEAALARIRIIKITTVIIAIVSTESGVGLLGLVLEGLAELSKGAVGAFL